MHRLVLGLALLVPLAVGAQQSPLDPARLRSRLQQSLDAATFAAVARVADGAERSGLPVEPIYTRALQGAAMRVPPAAIRKGVENLARRLAAAREALAPASPAELTAGAEALGKEVPASTLARIRAMRPNGSVAVELGVLAQLVTQGVPVTHASQKIAELMRAETRPAQIIAIGDSVRTDVAGGRRAIEAFDARARGILAAGSADGSLAADGRNVETTFMPPGTATNSPPRNNSPAGPTRAPRKP